MKPIALAVRSIRDFISGGLSGTMPETLGGDNPTGDWGDFLPLYEPQRNNSFDTMACVSFSAHNCLETMLNRWLQGVTDSSPIIERIAAEFLATAGYSDAGSEEPNFSDRYTAKMSGTTASGNSMRNVADSIRAYGLAPEKEYPFNPNMARWEYYLPVPAKIKNRAFRFSDFFDIKWEWINSLEINNLRNELKKTPLQIAVYAWGQKESGLYRRTLQKENHCVELYAITNKAFKVLDHLKDGQQYKELELTYRIATAMRYQIGLKGYNPMLTLKNDTLIQMAGENATGQFGLYLDGKILTGDQTLVLGTWFIRCPDFTRKRAVSRTLWDSVPKYDIRQPAVLLEPAKP